MNVKRNLSTSKELNVEFSLPNATTFGGALPVLTYMKKLRLENHFTDALAFSKGPTATYTLPQICLTQVAGRLLGKERICHFEEIEKDKFLARELGLSGGKLPDTTILYKDLDRFDSDEKVQMLKLVNDQVNLRQAKDGHSGFRLLRRDGLRPTRKNRCRLQSKRSWKSQFAPVALLRWYQP